MIYILCVVHVLYWLKIGEEPYLSIILFEMPVVFFISGAALSCNNKQKSFIYIMHSRFKRIMEPYYVYAFLSLCIISINTVLCIGSFDITKYVLHDYLNILTARTIPQSPYCWHLWFIIPYLAISVSAYFQFLIIKKIPVFIYITICTLVYLLTLCQPNVLIRYLCLYNIFFILGYLLYKRIPTRTILQLITPVSIVLILSIIATGGDMQEHKLNGDFIFLLYGLAALGVLSTVFSFIKIPQMAILNKWNKNGYTIYLYQNFFFCFFVVVILPLINNLPGFLIFLIAFFSIFSISTLSSNLIYGIEKRIISVVSTAVHKFIRIFR